VTPVRLCILALAGLGSVFAQRVGAPTGELDKLSVDELFSIQVSSVGRKAQQLSTAPAAVFVLTGEDIRRSGATSIPEALRWVPGLSVLSVDGRSWAISARGSNRVYSDKILVMIDGRPLYMPLFSGLLWDAVDLPLEEIEQIEVVRGPGAVMWGPNAVNGVINIITRKASAAKGLRVSGATGNESRATAEAAWSASTGDALSYRVWSKFDDRTPAFGSPGYYFFDLYNYPVSSIRDLDLGRGSAGFRIDGGSGEKDQWTVVGDIYRVDRHDPLAYPALAPSVDPVDGRTRYTGGFLQARWTRTTAGGGESALEISYDKTRLAYPFIDAGLNNLMMDYRRRWRIAESHEFYCGAGFQQYWDKTSANRFVAFDPANSVYRTGDVVARDEWQIVPGRVLGSAGIRIDYNSYRQIEYQPSIRLLYTPSITQSFWAAVSRAVKAPNRFDRDLTLDDGQMDGGGTPITMLFTGSKSMRSETERSVEAGYRRQSGQRWSADVSAFLSDYKSLRAITLPAEPDMDESGLTFSMAENNLGSGRSYGGELAGTVQINPAWRLLPSYSYVKDTRWLPASTTGSYFWDRLPSDLRHQGLLRSQHDLGRSLKLDLMARTRSRDRTFGTPGTLLLDVRLGWRPTRTGELSFTVQNVADRHLIEIVPEGVFPAIPIRRLLIVRWTQRF
jgi:iron complex outermembrane receptor protein